MRGSWIHLLTIGLWLGAGLSSRPAAGLETALVKSPLPPLPDETWDALRRGEVVGLETDREDDSDRSYADVVDLILVEAPIDLVFRTADDCSTFSEFMPNMENVTLMDGEGDAQAILARLWRFELAGFIFRISYHPITVSDFANGVIEFALDRQLPNDLIMADGHWWFYPEDEGGATLVVFAAKVETTYPVPQWMEDYVVDTAYKDLLRNLRSRVLSGGVWKRGDPLPEPTQAPSAP